MLASKLLYKSKCAFEALKEPWAVCEELFVIVCLPESTDPAKVALPLPLIFKSYLESVEL